MRYKKMKILGLISLIFLTACSKSSINNDPNRKLSQEAKVVAFGDSLTFGAGTTRDKAYPSVLSSKIGREVINEGINGDTAKNGVNRIKDVLDEHTPELVIVALGGNDMLKKQDQQLKDNLGKIIKTIKDDGKQVVLLATPTPSVLGHSLGMLSDAPLYEEVAKENDVLLFPNIYSKHLSSSENRSDPIHLNAKGYALVAEDIAQYLKKAGFID